MVEASNSRTDSGIRVKAKLWRVLPAVARHARRVGRRGVGSGVFALQAGKLYLVPSELYDTSERMRRQGRQVGGLRRRLSIVNKNDDDAAKGRREACSQGKMRGWEEGGAAEDIDKKTAGRIERRQAQEQSRRAMRLLFVPLRPET